MGGAGGYAPVEVTVPPKTPSPFSTSIRFFGLRKQPESDNGATPGLELDESDVIWDPDLKSDLFGPDSDTEPDSEPDLSSSLPTRSTSGRIGPVPVNVPEWHRRRAPPSPPRFDDALDEEDDDVDGEEYVEMVPPHVIVARSHVTTFSVFEGVGRTLKGRDLRRVRNAVFQQTGFL